MEAVYSNLKVTATLLGVDYVNDKDAYLVEYVYPNKNKERAWYDTKTGLKVKSLTYGGSGQVTVFYNDYKPVNGVMMPYYMKQDLGGFVLEMSINSVEFNTGVKDEFFNVK
jgi:hypothetical protein